MTTFCLENVPSQSGRVAIVTGANTGLGYETTLGLAQTGATVVMACRSLTKAEAAQQQILQQIPSATLDILPLDLSDLSSVRHFADLFRQKYNRLDLLINNAGIMIPPYGKTMDGFESQLGANHLGHFLLTALLVALMPDAAESRVVSLSSIAHKRGVINFSDLQSEKSYSKTAAYAQSKLACLMFTDELQRRLDKAGKKLLSVCAHPGGSPTELSRNMSKTLSLFVEVVIVPLFTHPVDQGALPTLMAALDKAVRGGEYFGPQGFMEMRGEPGRATRAKQACDEDVARRLWEVSERLTGCEFVVN